MGQFRSRTDIDLNVTTASLQRILDGDAKELVIQAEHIGNKLGRELTTNQIRAVFGTVREIENQWGNTVGDAQRQLILLKPKMAYRASKDGFRGKGMQALADVLGQAIDIVTEEKNNPDPSKRFKHFVEFFEAILAYHKVAGGI